MNGTTKITTASLISPGATVTIDPFGLNPLAEDATQTTVAPPKTPAPKLFTGGTADLPAFTASGLDPKLLLALPFTIRHYVASLRSPAEAHQVFEECSNEPTARVLDQGLNEAIQRVRAWVIGG